MADNDLTVINHMNKCVFHATHAMHINQVELFVATWVVCMAPSNTCLWVDSKTIIGWTKHTKFVLPLAALMSTIAYIKNITFTWIPSKWNLADCFTQQHHLHSTMTDYHDMMLLTLQCMCYSMSDFF